MRNRNNAAASRSIARRINAHLQWRGLWRGVFLDIFIAAVALLFWCGVSELAELGQLNLDAPRGFAWAEIEQNGTALRQLRYCFGPELGQSVNAGRFVLVAAGTFLVVLSFQTLFWVLRWLGGTSRIRRFLRPVDSIAAAAQTISAGEDENRFRDVADAIDHLNAASPNVKLSLGGAEMSELEDAVNSLIARMQESYRRQIRFVDDASHELRTPIAVIQGYVNMLDRWGKSDEKVLEESIAAIQTESSHMKTLVEQLLFLARGDMGRQKFKFEALELAQLLQEVRDESELIDETHPYSLTVEAACTVRADAAMLKQAVRILVDNAAKYTPEHGAIALRLGSDGREARISVQDEGRGIAPADAEHVFERFYRADKARNSSGSGLGLAIAKWIVDQHGGRFELVSYEGVGSRFTICIPLGSAALPPARPVQTGGI